MVAGRVERGAAASVAGRLERRRTAEMAAGVREVQPGRAVAPVRAAPREPVANREPVARWAAREAEARADRRRGGTSGRRRYRWNGRRGWASGTRRNGWSRRSGGPGGRWRHRGNRRRGRPGRRRRKRWRRWDRRDGHRRSGGRRTPASTRSCSTRARTASRRRARRRSTPRRRASRPTRARALVARRSRRPQDGDERGLRVGRSERTRHDLHAVQRAAVVVRDGIAGLPALRPTTGGNGLSTGGALGIAPTSARTIIAVVQLVSATQAVQRRLSGTVGDGRAPTSASTPTRSTPRAAARAST